MKQVTINKSLLLNWLYSADKELPIEELGKWIAAKTSGEYILVDLRKSSEDQKNYPQHCA